jgi:hypothetical protein
VKIHLVDGTFELFRCFHGAPRVRLEGGRDVGAVRGLLATMVSLLSQPDVTHVAVAFDPLPGRPRTPLGASDDDLLRSQYLPAEEMPEILGRVRRRRDD